MRCNRFPVRLGADDIVIALPLKVLGHWLNLNLLDDIDGNEIVMVINLNIPQ